jgi:glyoxylase-like metal-dependent hydrolase (beta-lactamase superfamily II)
VVGPPPADWQVDPSSVRVTELERGLWRLSLPCAYERVRHVNAYAIDAGDGITLVDCGPGGDVSCERALENALGEIGRSVADVNRLVLTHIHPDHAGLAAWVRSRSGARVLTHPGARSGFAVSVDPDGVRRKRRHRAWLEGVPDIDLDGFEDVRGDVIRVVDYEPSLVGGTTLDSTLGDWQVIDTPGHATSHIALLQAEHRLLISGDVLLPRFAPWYDYGHSADPVGEFLRSLNVLETRASYATALPGHGRPIAELPRLITSYRAGVGRRLERVEQALARRSGGAYEVGRRVFRDAASVRARVHSTTETVAYLRHLRGMGRVQRTVGDDERLSYAIA